MIKEAFGLAFLAIGVIFAALCKYSCSNLCKGNCVSQDISYCFFLFLFVSILLIICGASIIITRKVDEK
jgi:hypothetical protein